MSCSHQGLGELELQLCQWWDWSGEEDFGGLGTANLSSQIEYLQTVHSQEQLELSECLSWAGTSTPTLRALLGSLFLSLSTLWAV